VQTRLIERRTELQWVEVSCKTHAHTRANRGVTVGLFSWRLRGYAMRGLGELSPKTARSEAPKVARVTYSTGRLRGSANFKLHIKEAGQKCKKDVWFVAGIILPAKDFPVFFPVTREIEAPSRHG